jgi:cyclic pyranopterin phosphate synthase
VSQLTHFDESGNAVMVDVSGKAVTDRTAVASGSVRMQPETIRRILDGGIKKGDVLAVAQLAGIMGAKRTPDLIPLCHPLSLSSVKLSLTVNETAQAVEIEAICRVTGQTGVEMEALTAVSVAALTIYDMCKAIDRSMVIGEIKLEHKSGGRSGTWNTA